MKYGGNTSCIEINLGERRILLDGGTGLRNAARNFMDDPSREIYLLFTHTHWDHINGFPFFLPAYNPDWTVRVKAGHMKHTGGIRSVLSSQMATPMFPIPIEALKANLTYEDFEAGEDFELYPGVHVRTAPLNHPNGATAYRIEHEGRACVYVTDTEHVPGKPDRNILGVIEGADLVIYDSTYTEREWPEKIGCDLVTLFDRLASSPYTELAPIMQQLPVDPKEIGLLLEGLRAVCRDLLILQTVGPQPGLFFSEFISTLQQWSESLNREQIFQIIDEIGHLQRGRDHNLTPLLLWESLAFTIQREHHAA